MTTRPTPHTPPAHPGHYRGGNARTSRSSIPGDPPAPDDPLLGFTPAPHAKPRKNTITPARQRAFITALAATGIVTQAAKTIGASTDALYRLRHRPGAEDFASAWDEAIDRGMARLEDSALARAMAGEERLVVSRGEVVGTEIRHNEALVMFFLKNRRGGRYSAHVRPGHPLYERIRAEVLEDFHAKSAEAGENVLENLTAKFDLMRERDAALKQLLAGDTASGEADSERD